MSNISARSIWTRSAKLFLCAAALTMLTPAANAQFSDSYKFLKAVKDSDGAKATELIDEPGKGPVIINTGDDVTGETALHIVTRRRDPAWLGFLLQKGANPNKADRQSSTPLILATQLGFADGAELLLEFKANVNMANRSGETALILATQLRNPELVRLLLANGADPDKTDSVAGMSAREYAARDGRGSGISNIIESHSKAKAKPAKDLDFSGIGETK